MHKQSTTVGWNPTFYALANDTHNLLVLAALDAKRKPAAKNPSEKEQTKTPEVSSTSRNSSWEAISITSANWAYHFNDVTLVVWIEALVVGVISLIVGNKSLVLIWVKSLVLIRVETLISHENLIGWYHVWVLIVTVVGCRWWDIAS